MGVLDTAAGKHLVQSVLDEKDDTPSGSDTAMVARLRASGLRPTRQRMAIAEVLFGKGDRHISAEALRDEIDAAGHVVSLATVYNALHQFQRAGLIRELAVDGTKTYFDTNTSDHSHFFIEETSELVDIPSAKIRVMDLPEPPEGTEICHVDVIVRVSKIT